MSETRTVQCRICPKMCLIPPGRAGDCRVRINRDGKLIATTFERPCALHVDPVEKKPLFHFLPGSRAFSVATVGCNLHCRNCQNWQISQADPMGAVAARTLTCEELAQTAIDSECQSIAYTYTDPIVYYEYALETSGIARKKRLRNILVTAGYINPEPLRELCKVTDAANVDLKFIDDAHYRSNCDATLKPVQDALVIMKEEGVWLEITNLVIPTLNDDEASMKTLCQWVVANLGTDVPLHFSRFHPTYRLRNLPPTPEDTLVRARNIALETGIHYCFIGNVWGSEGEHTFCPTCKTRLVERVGYTIRSNRITRDGKCPKCDAAIAGVWS